MKKKKKKNDDDKNLSTDNKFLTLYMSLISKMSKNDTNKHHILFVIYLSQNL